MTHVTLEICLPPVLIVHIVLPVVLAVHEMPFPPVTAVPVRMEALVKTCGLTTSATVETTTLEPVVPQVSSALVSYTHPKPMFILIATWLARN